MDNWKDITRHLHLPDTVESDIIEIEYSQHIRSGKKQEMVLQVNSAQHIY